MIKNYLLCEMQMEKTCAEDTASRKTRGKGDLCKKNG